MPAEVDTGDRIRLSGEGEAGEGGRPPGDLYVEVQIKPHPIFTREDSTLYCELPISFPTAALGGDLDVPTLDGLPSMTRRCTTEHLIINTTSRSYQRA